MKSNIFIWGVVIIAAIYIIYNFFLKGSSEFTVDSAKFEELEKGSDVVILDVRSAFEFGGDKIQGAQNVSYTSGGFKNYVEKLDKSKTYLVYCATGSRSSGAVSTMKKMGFEKVYNLKGGIENWKSDGKPVVR